MQGSRPLASRTGRGPDQVMLKKCLRIRSATLSYRGQAAGAEQSTVIGYRSGGHAASTEACDGDQGGVEVPRGGCLATEPEGAALSF
jgi:hypothetical protein